MPDHHSPGPQSSGHRSSTHRLQVGVVLPDLDRPSSRSIRESARLAEDLGMDAVFMGDHLLPVVPYPDSTIVLATAAASTERIRIGFSVMVLALRPVAWAAKQIATLQQVFGDRIVLGIGTGGALHGRTAWDAVGVTYERRGRLTDEALDVLPTLIAGEPGRVGDVEVALRPGATVPPLWIGGNSPAALRRTARYGEAWFPSMMPPALLAEGARRLRELAAEHGRTTPDIAVGGIIGLGTSVPRADIEQTVRALVDGYGVPEDHAPQVPITGSPAEAADQLARLAEAGARHVVLGTIGDDWRKQWELLAQARELLPTPPARTRESA